MEHVNFHGSALIIVSEKGCPACKVWKPVLEKIGRRHPSVLVQFVSAAHPAAWVQSIDKFPTTLVVRRGHVVKQIYGAYGEPETERIFCMAER